MRGSSEVDWKPDGFGACFGRPDGFGSSDFAQIVDFCRALSIYIWVSGADVINIMDLLTEEGSKFDDL